MSSTAYIFEVQEAGHKIDEDSLIYNSYGA